MRKIIEFEDGSTAELSPITYLEFMAIDEWYGSSNAAFEEFLRHNKLTEICDFRNDQKVIWRFEPGDRTLEFNFGSDEEPQWRSIESKEIALSNIAHQC